MSFVQGLVSPVIVIYFVSRVTTEVVATSNIMAIVLAVFTNSILQKERVMAFAHKHFVMLLLTDLAITILANTIGVDWPAARFIIMNISTASVLILSDTVMSDLVNKVLRGRELTNFKLKCKTMYLYAALVGAAINFVCTVDIVVAVTIQCFGLILAAVCDREVYKRLEPVISESIHATNNPVESEA